MGIAKEKMFGQKPRSKWQAFIDRGTLLSIDIAYAKNQVPDGDEAQLALHAALLASAREGHLCLEKSVVEDLALAALLPEGRHYLPKYEEVENQIVYHCKRLVKPAQDQKRKNTQEEAIENAFSYPFSLITGGPGTGKTYTAVQIVNALHTETIVTAPTGKAAMHLQNQMKLPVKGGTLHSILMEEETLEANLVIVDECSMIDPLLFSRLLAAIPSDCTLVLMGDENQLPAVEGGSVFADLISSQSIPTTFLSKCMRSDRREILNVANAILSGEVEDMRTIDLGFTEGKLETLYQKLWDYVKDKDFSHFRILSTLRKGPLGVDALNRYLFEKFSPHAESFPIMITRNDRRTGLANGETGVLKGKEACFGEQRFELQELPSYEHAYCISVHKSQGSEYDDVLFLVPEGSENFGKEVLFTAVTRAKKNLAIDGSKGQIDKALRRSFRKISGIQEKINIK